MWRKGVQPIWATNRGMLRNTQTSVPCRREIWEGTQTNQHSVKKENEKLKCRTLIETNILGNPNTETKGVTNNQI